MKRSEVLDRLADMVESVRLDHPARVAIDGVDGAGKTMLADELAAVLKARKRTCIRASLDGFHRPRSHRYRPGRDSSQGYFIDSFDLDTVRSVLLAPLGPGGSRRFRREVFDHRRDRRFHAPERVAPEDAILLFDGIFLLRPELAANWDLSIFVQVRLETGARRAMHRDATGAPPDASATRLYRRRYMPAQRRYLATFRPREQAHVVLLNEDPREPELTLNRGVG